MSSIPCNIVALPADDIAEKAIQLSADLAQHGAYFTLEEGSFYPHISLYMTQLKIADIDEAIALLADIASSTPNLELAVNGYF